MGLLDLSTSVSSKKHVDFNDARYQLADKLRQNNKKQIRSTFTLYDNKEYNKIAVQEIAAAYSLSDKKLPIGELINKMVDLIVDLEDGALDTEKDAIYAWKYSMALLDMYEDKRKRQESLSAFDNSLKSAIINSETFIRRYPGKYTNRTNFFNNKTKLELMDDIINTFKDETLQAIHDVAIKQSREIAEKHSNPILDRIVNWAIDNYKCGVDSFFEIKEEQGTKLFYSVNTIILHLKNGYDMSIVGYVGTDHDDKFATSIFNANNINLEAHSDRVQQGDIQSTLTSASTNDPVDPLTKLLKMEKHKNDVLKKQYDALANIRPMVPADVLDLQAAETVVGGNYIWGCKQFRTSHEELPEDFQLADAILPEFLDLGEYAEEESQGLVDAVNEAVTSLDNAIEDVDIQSVQNQTNEEFVSEQNNPGNKDDNVQAITPPAPSVEADTNTELLFDEQEPITAPQVQEPITSNDLFKDVTIPEDLFKPEEKKPKVETKQFGDPTRKVNNMPTLTIDPSQKRPVGVGVSTTPQKKFDSKATLLPGVMPIKKPKQENNGPSFTSTAQPMPKQNAEPSWKPDNTQLQNVKPAEKQQKKDDVVQPDIILNDLDSLFV